MTDPLPDRLQELLRSLLAGEVPPQDAEVVRQLEQSKELRQEWQEYLKLRRGLEESAAERAEILAEVAAEEESPEEEKLLADYRRILAEPPRAPQSLPLGGRAPASRLWLPLALAAALVLLVWWAPWEGSGANPPTGPTPVGVEQPLELQAPVDHEGRWLFQWKSLDDRAVTFKILLYDTTASDATARLFEQSSRSSLLSYELRATLPQSILWRVQSFDATNALLGQQESIFHRPPGKRPRPADSGSE